MPVELIYTDYIHGREYDAPGDWAVWLITEPKYYNKDYFNTLVPSENLDVINAGWGAIRVLKNDEIQKLKSFLQKEGDNIQTADLYEKFAKELEDLNLSDLEDGDQLKASKCKVFYNKSNPYILKTNCDSWAGNSGGGCVQDDTLYGILSYGTNTFDDASNRDYMVSAKQFKAKLQELIKKHWPKDQAVNPELSYNTQFNVKLQEPIKSTAPDQAANPEWPYKPNSRPVVPGIDVKKVQADMIALYEKKKQEEREKEQEKWKKEQIEWEEEDKKYKLSLSEDTEWWDNHLGLNDSSEASVEIIDEEEDPLFDVPGSDNENSVQEELSSQAATEESNLNPKNNQAGSEGGDESVAANSAPGTVAIEQNQESDSGDLEAEEYIFEYEEAERISNAISASFEEYLQSVQQAKEDLAEQQEELSKKVQKGVRAVRIMDNRRFLGLLDDIVELNTISQNLKKLEDTYQQAKKRETSLANRTLTAMTMAATGIGGMQLAQGLAEQKADKDAEMAMNAYMATFRCEYGGGKSFKGGATQIELPGGNNSEMMKMRQSYFKLAADLKERKNILGLKAGIESLVVLDKVQTGLYDDEGVGVTSGAYGSLYRAKMGNEADQAKLDEAEQVSAGRVKGGGAALGTGAVGGVSGDLLINHMQKK
ncbi:MAG: hypothetical protein R8M70_04080 [Alphaproteobacteria bacterium]|nr:hypothetical protein [Alphaproteobacteria bacterium]